MPPKHRRTRTKPSYESDEESNSDSNENNIRYIHEDEETGLNDEEMFDSEESSEDDNDNTKDDDYFPTKEGKRKAVSKKRQQERVNKKRKTLSYSSRTATSAASDETREEQEQYLEIVKEFEHSELFSILASSDEISISEIVRELLEQYSENRDEVIQKFINLLLDCCGAMIHVQNHDIHSNESASDTLSELQLSFQNQKIHEFNLLISKTKRRNTQIKPLYQNFEEFMFQFLEIADDLQLLYNEDGDQDNTDDEANFRGMKMGPLILDLLTWLSAFSVSKIRCFRYVSTLTLYTFQDYLSAHAVSLEKDYLAKLTKQLKMENKKKRPNKKTIEKLEENVEEIQSNKAIIDNIIDNIVKLCFVHRFKDVDEAIRSESMSHLAIWIENNPEYFMKVTFLKYFGWLLSDSSVNVRLQILKSLPDIIKSSHHSAMVDNAAIRQFFERFKSRILEIATMDIDMEVSINAINVLIEASSLDYLEDSEILMISSLIFNNEDTKVSSTSKNSRLMATVAKFLARVSNQKYEAFINSIKLNENSSTIKTSVIIKIGTIMRILNCSLLYFIDNNKNYDPSLVSRSQILFQAAEFLYPFFGSQVDSICRLLADDDQFSQVYQEITKVSDDDDDNDEMNIDNNEPLSQTRIDRAPLFPTENENVTFYIIVLSGLCDGGMNGRNQNKYSIATSVLPHLENLLKNLSINSTSIFLQILSIFNLFNFDEWVHSGCEKDIKGINSMILKGFSGVVLMHTDSNDITYETFSKTVHHIKEFHLKDIDEVWLNEISMIKLQFEKYITEKNNYQADLDFGEYTNSIYSQYVNRLVLLGKEYPIEFSSDLLKLFIDKFMSKLIYEVGLGSIENIEVINFKLPVILVTWELQKWIDILEKSNSVPGLPSDDPERSSNMTNVSSVRNALSYMSSIIVNMESVLIQINNLTGVDEVVVHKLRSSLASSLIDVLVATKCFELQLPEDEINWKEMLHDVIHDSYLNEEVYNALLDTFLYFESIYARDQGIQLDRSHDEDVTLNEVALDSENMTSERDLLVFTIKLIGLKKLELLDDKTSTRVSLNKEILGPLFKSVIDDSIFDDANNGTTRSLKNNAAQLITSPEPLLSRETSNIAQTSDRLSDQNESDSSISSNSNTNSNRRSKQLMDLNIIEENSEELDVD
ncbi:similar to Saccharomyces cerevisiae YIL026C IRR1 Subunit of the cohesin complex [Maudiozyma saulgeensis]|uniref:Similar to Saccharomyces cerevisiae YIL026C IRR1 Subunit of the cohesin complex n=1 Tax=Maudiozyma saulgeensis TaxID=1789683 RepID=A0A1X7R305_9SACH|nr:similar to Saccharomyces cerevisiae YIL026C IRR1 Subunit of the cohesin complex [Kazachstania saulgeensis]